MPGCTDHQGAHRVRYQRLPIRRYPVMSGGGKGRSLPRRAPPMGGKGGAMMRAPPPRRMGAHRVRAHRQDGFVEDAANYLFGAGKGVVQNAPMYARQAQRLAQQGYNTGMAGYKQAVQTRDALRDTYVPQAQRMIAQGEMAYQQTPIAGTKFAQPYEQAYRQGRNYLTGLSDQYLGTTPYIYNMAHRVRADAPLMLEYKPRRCARGTRRSRKTGVCVASKKQPKGYYSAKSKDARIRTHMIKYDARQKVLVEAKALNEKNEGKFHSKTGAKYKKIMTKKRSTSAIKKSIESRKRARYTAIENPKALKRTEQRRASAARRRSGAPCKRKNYSRVNGKCTYMLLR